MREHLPILKQSALFKDFIDDEIIAVLACIGAKQITIKKNSSAFDSSSKLGIVLAGSLQNIQIDYNGNQNILLEFLPSDTFGDAISIAHVRDLPFNVIAKEDSEVLFLDCERVLNVCANACKFHIALMKNMLILLAKKNVALSTKLLHITKRSIREKVLSYLLVHSETSAKKTFTIPFSRQELADYLSVDRSALSYELSRLQKEGILTYKKNTFTLLHE